MAFSLRKVVDNMKYNMIEIIPRGLDRSNPWIVKFDDSDQRDRLSSKEYTPSSLGFFYYPRRWKAKKAFEILKADMMKRRQKEIVTLQKDIDLIGRLELPDWIEKL